MTRKKRSLLEKKSKFFQTKIVKNYQLLILISVNNVIL